MGVLAYSRVKRNTNEDKMLRPRRWTRFSQQQQHHKQQVNTHNSSNNNKLPASPQPKHQQQQQLRTKQTAIRRRRLQQQFAALAACVAVAVAAAAALDVFVAAVTLQCAFARWTRRYTKLKEVNDKRARLSINARATFLAIWLWSMTAFSAAAAAVASVIIPEISAEQNRDKQTLC